MAIKPTKSYMTFESVAKRSLNLLALQEPLEKVVNSSPNATGIDFSDMTRAAVVLAVAAMDAYFTDVFAESLVAYLRKKGAAKSMVSLLREAGLDTECALELLAMERPYRRIRTLIESHLSRKTTQMQAVIDELFLAYGLKGFSENVEKLKKRKTLLKSINSLVLRRHRIAHEGDLNAHNRVTDINCKQIRKRINDVVVFVAGADELLQRQFPV